MSLRTLWSLLTILLITVMAVVMMASVASVEKQAWVESEDQQARLLMNLLVDELKVPMMAVSASEVDMTVKRFMARVPDASVFLHWSNGRTEKFGDQIIPGAIEAMSELAAVAEPVAGMPQWYAMGIKYNGAALGSIALLLPGKSWRENDIQIKMRLIATAAVMAILVALLIYGLSGRIVNQLRLLARACKRVGNGDFSLHLPITSSNEFGKAFHQFNKMVAQLGQREKVYDLYGRYQRPQQVADAYDRNALNQRNIEREVTVLVMDMIAFDVYRQQHRDEDVIALLNQYFALFQQIIYAFGGHVDHIIGDKMVAVFNHPFELKSHENQAVKAGLAIIEAGKRMSSGRTDAASIVFRVGLAIGDVTIGHLGVGRRKDFTIVGAPLALAGHLAKLGDGSELHAPYGTMLSLGHGYKQKDLGEQLVDGQQIRCIHVQAGEAYVTQEIDAVVGKAFGHIEPDTSFEDEGW